MKTRFILQDGSLEIYECADRDGKARVILDSGRLRRILHYIEGIPPARAIAAVDAFRAREYADFLQWAARNNHPIDLSEYPAPRPIAAPD